MRRFIYSLPLIALLLPWTFIALVILGVGLFSNPFSLLLLWPLFAIMAAAWWVHRYYARRDRHGSAALGASFVLFAPLFAIIVAFFTHGADVLTRPEYRPMVQEAVGEVAPHAPMWEASRATNDWTTLD